MISTYQNASIEGGQILDVVLIANKATDLKIQCCDCGVLCNLDDKKDYDHISWKFLLVVGFGEKLIEWINWYISAARFFLLFNGTSFGFFQSSREILSLPIHL